MGAVDYSIYRERLVAQSDRWSLMFEFLHDWDLPREGAETVADTEIIEAETRLGLTLPKALKEWFQLPFNPFVLDCRLFWTHMVWPQDLKVWPKDGGNDGAIVFKTEYQGCCDWAFLAKDAHLDDPPVFIGVADDDSSASEWQLQNETFSGFMLQLLMVRSVDFASGFHACKNRVTNDAWDRVGDHFASVGFPAWLEYGGDCQLLGGEDALLLVRSSPPSVGEERDLCLNAKTPEAREKARCDLGIDWDCADDRCPDGKTASSRHKKSWWRFW